MASGGIPGLLALAITGTLGAPEGVAVASLAHS